MNCSEMPQAVESMSPQDVMSEVRKFIQGAVRFSHSTNTVELTRTALILLKNVPATRDAILQYFCSIFHVTVNKYVRQIESDLTGTIHEETIIAEIHTVLSNFINDNPEAWAPIISSWSLDLLGKLSTEFAIRGNLRNNSGINEFLQQWMSCKATRTLIEITSQCLQCLIYSDTESCIKALLDTSLIHSPNFDWVVTHVGSCFPNTVITRVLSCGLKDFCALGYDRDVKNPKLNSVIGILGHLAASHSHDIRKALLNLFKWSLEESVNEDEETKAQKIATVPYLLNLANLSNTLLKTITTDFIQILKPEIIPQLALFSSEWCKYFDNQPDQLIELTADLALDCEQDALQVINTLLDASLSTSNVGYHSVNTAQSVKSVCRQILELILKKMDLMIRTQDIELRQTTNVGLLNSLRHEMPKIKPLLLNSNPLRVQTAVKLVSLMGTLSQNVLITAATYMLENAQTDFHLAALLRLVIDNIILFSLKKIDTDNSLLNQDFFTQVVEQSVRQVQISNSDEYNGRLLFQNLTTICKWENHVPCLQSKFISQAIQCNYEHIATFLMKTDNFDLANDIAMTIDSLGPPNGEKHLNNQGCAVKLKLTRAMLRFFFICIAQDDLIKKERGVKIICRCLRELTCFEVKKELNCFDGRNHADIVNHSSICARNLALRELLEQSIFNEPAKYFGAKEKFQPKNEETLLLQHNHKQGTSLMLTQKHSSVFHAGVIGNGPRKLPPENPLDKESITLNRTLLMDVIKSCCTTYENKQYIIHSQLFKMVSLLLVELVSPDVMYNGLPWPDEDFTKVTVERDLQIRRTFKDVPLLWTLLELTAWYRPSLTTCSVLLRAIAATVIANWNLSEGILLTNVMALGQILPPPLASIRDILPILDFHQLNTIMRDCIWAYMHENVPTPTLFTQVEGASIAWRDIDTSATNVRYTETLRLLLLANIHNLGSLYSTLFYDPNK